MSRRFVFCGVFLFLCSYAFAMPIKDHKIEPKALAELCAAFGIQQDEDVVAQTQKQWLRKPGQERWELQELSEEKRVFVLNWAREQGLFDPWVPSCSFYNKALILGATTSRMQTRLDDLKKLWQEGIRFEEIVWLTGDRPLDPRVDRLLEDCTTESAAARYLWEHADLPENMRALSVRFVAVPMKTERGVIKRPSTEDTIIAWFNEALSPCSCLFVSNQPFCGYQFAVIKAVLPESFLFDVVGEGADPQSDPAPAATILDTVARWIYQDRKVIPFIKK